jgi:single-strand DNA-binding protein
MLMGRLARDPEVRYSQGSTPVAIANYDLAVNRRFKRDGEPDADFIKCVAFGKSGEFAEKWLKKGQMFAVVGRIQTRSWDGKDGKKCYATEVVVEEHYFTGGKNETGQSTSTPPTTTGDNEGFYPIDESLEDDDLPF